MTHQNSMYLSVFGRKTADQKQFKVYIKIRISGIGEKSISAGVSVPIANFKNGKFTGRIASVMEAEKNTNTLKDLLQDSYWDLVRREITPVPDLVVSNVHSMRKAEKSLMELMDIVVEQKEEMARSGEASLALPEKFRVLRNNVSDFTQYLYKKRDIFLYEVNLDFVSRFAVYLKAMPNGNVTINKKIGNLGQCFIYAMQNQWMPVNPCVPWKSLPEPKTNEEYLTLAQLESVIDFKLPNESYEMIKDGFIFMCFTGLAYTDVKAFKFSNVTYIDGEPAIFYNRTKTKKPVKVPLLPTAMDLVLKHYSRPIRKGKRDLVEKGPEDPIFPIQANATFNEKLKTFFEFNEFPLDFSICTHSGRKTFGNMITQLLSLPDASQLLGHSSIDVTQESYVNNYSDELVAKRGILMRAAYDKIFGSNKNKL